MQQTDGEKPFLFLKKGVNSTVLCKFDGASLQFQRAQMELGFVTSNSV